MSNPATCAHDWSAPDADHRHVCGTCGVVGKATRPGGPVRALIQTHAPVNTTFGVEDRLGPGVRGAKITTFRRG